VASAGPEGKYLREEGVEREAAEGGYSCSPRSAALSKGAVLDPTLGRDNMLILALLEEKERRNTIQKIKRATPLTKHPAGEKVYFLNS